MIILAESKRILAHSGLNNANVVRIASVNVPQLLVHVVILTALVSCVVLECIIYVDISKHGIDAILLPLVVSSTFMALILAYISLIWKSEQIMRLMDYLQHVVDESKWNSLSSPNFAVYCNCLTTFYIVPTIGAQNAPDSVTVHHSRNETTEEFIRLAYWFSRISLASAHAVPAMCPILYKLLGFPSPALWFTPIGIEKV